MRRFASEKLKHWVRLLLHTQDSPRRTAFAFALGVFISFLPPVPWFHTLFALFLAFLFRLNRLAVLIGTYVNSPFTIAPLVVCEVWVGMQILGGNDVPDVTLRQLAHLQGWKEAFVELRPFLAPLLLGCLLLGILVSTVAYFIALNLILVYRRRIAHATLLARADLEVAPPPSESAEPMLAGKAPRKAPGNPPRAVPLDSPEKPS